MELHKNPKEVEHPDPALNIAGRSFCRQCGRVYLGNSLEATIDGWRNFDLPPWQSGAPYEVGTCWKCDRENRAGGIMSVNFVGW